MFYEDLAPLRYLAADGHGAHLIVVRLPAGPPLPARIRLCQQDPYAGKVTSAVKAPPPLPATSRLPAIRQTNATQALLDLLVRVIIFDAVAFLMISSSHMSLCSSTPFVLKTELLRLYSNGTEIVQVIQCYHGQSRQLRVS